MSPAASAPAPTEQIWRCGRYRLVLDRVQIMGVLNVTPDSFSDGGRYTSLAAALAHAHEMIAAGADILDIGGESTRPGAYPVPPEEELARVLPVLRALRDAPVPLSIDTSQPQVMRAALDLGVAIINDVRSLRLPGAEALACASADCGVVLMHMQGEPANMQREPCYGAVVDEVMAWLVQRRDRLVTAGIGAERIALDPGFGFGKTPGHNRQLLGSLERLRALGHPVLVGLSRKSTLGELTGRPVTERMPASVAAALVAASKGAAVIRVHDVGATRDALAVWRACVAPAA